MSRIYDDLRGMLRHELGVLTKKGDITKEVLDNISKLTSSLTMVESLMEREEGTTGTSSNDYSRRYEGSYDYGRGTSREDGHGYTHHDGSSYDYSGRRGRDSMGRYTSRDGDYSRAGDKEHMIHKMREMMQTAGTAREREAIQKCIEELEM